MIKVKAPSMLRVSGRYLCGPLRGPPFVRRPSRPPGSLMASAFRDLCRWLLRRVPLRPVVPPWDE